MPDTNSHGAQIHLYTSGVKIFRFLDFCFDFGFGFGIGLKKQSVSTRAQPPLQT